MKKILCVLFFIIIPTHFTSAESIKHFISDIDIHSNNTAYITEKIIYDFGTEYRHGIFRYIPQDFRPTGNILPIDIDIISVTDEKGNDYEYSESGFLNKEVKIGDPETQITGIRTYIISYKVKGPIGFLENEDELYWNVTGNDWQNVTIERTEVIVTLPKESAVPLTVFDYCGPEGSQTSCGSIVNESRSFIEYTSEKDLSPGEGITLSVTFSKNIVTPTTFLQLMARTWLYLIPLCLGIYIGIRLMKKRIRKYIQYRRYKKAHPEVVQYDPADTTPIEASYFHEGIIKDRDVSAYIVWMAIRGYIVIKQENKDYYFEKKKEWVEDLPAEEVAFLNKLIQTKITKKFGSTTIEPIQEFKKGKGLMRFFYTQKVHNNVFKMSVGTALVQILNATIEKLETDGYIEKSITYGTDTKSTVEIPLPAYIKKSMDEQGLEQAYQSMPRFSTHLPRFASVLIALFLAVNPGVFIFAIVPPLGVIWSISCVMIALCAILIPSVPPYTEKGLEKSAYINGLARYIKMAEKDRINVLNAPEKTPLLFEKLLPYAMIFGYEKKWIKEFEGFDIRPEWYASNDVSFNFAALSGLSSSLSQSMVSTSSSSGAGGGGSSGGGGGGGGGGSW